MHAIIRFVINYSISKTYYITYYLPLNFLKNLITYIENLRRVHTSENVKKNLKVVIVIYPTQNEGLPSNEYEIL